MEKYIEEAETYIKIDTYHLWISPSGEYIEHYDSSSSNYTKIEAEYSA